MMKNLKLWQKAGLATLVALPLALGLGFNFNKNSKGLESKLPSIGISVAEAKEVKTEGYEVPDLTGYTKTKEGYLDLDRTQDGIKETFVEIFQDPNGKVILKYQTKGKTWAWFYAGNPSDRKDTINNYTIVDSDCDGIFDEKYGSERYYVPKCLE